MNVEDILRKYKAGEVELGFDDIHIEEFNDGSKEIFMERTIEGLETGETISLLFPEKEHVKELKLAIEEVETTLKVEAAEDFGDSDTTKLLKEELEILRERWAYTLSDEGGGQFDYDNPAGISIDGGEIEWIETNNEVTKTRKVDWEP